jgi:hypothetical protein
MIRRRRGKFSKKLAKNNCKKWRRIEIKIYIKSTQKKEEKIQK